MCDSVMLIFEPQVPLSEKEPLDCPFNLVGSVFWHEVYFAVCLIFFALHWILETVRETAISLDEGSRSIVKD